MLRVFPPINLCDESEGTFIKQTFGSEKDPVKHFYQKILFRVKIKIYVFLGILEKLKINLFWGLFGQKWKKLIRIWKGNEKFAL